MRPIGRMLRRSAVMATVLALVVSATALAVTWGPAVAVSASGHASALPEAAVVTGTQRVHVFYTEEGTPWQAWYRQSSDGGATWAARVRLSHGTAYGAEASAINRYGTTLDVVWWEWDASSNYRIWYRQSLNAGTSWSTPIVLTPSIGDAGRADVARAGDRVTVTYTDGASGKIYVRISTNGGASFGARVAIGTTTNQPYLPSASSYDAYASDGDSAGTITVVWDSSSSAIKIRRSTDGGATWSTPVTLETNSYGYPITLTTVSAKIIIGYIFKTPGGSRATQRHSADEGLHWTAAAYVAAGAPSGVPSYAYRGGVLRAVYTRCTASDCSTEAAFSRTSTDFGTTWSGESRASRSVDAPYAFALGVGVIANGQSVVIYERWDGGSTTKLYSRMTV
jgi:hypothetical protein